MATATMGIAEFLRALQDEPPWEEVVTVQVDSRDISGDTPLHWALWRKEEEIAAELIAAGADINAKGEEGCTPLHVAVAMECIQAIRLLNERGADWGAMSKLDSTPLEDAADSQNPLIRAFASEVK